MSFEYINDHCFHAFGCSGLGQSRGGNAWFARLMNPSNDKLLPRPHAIDKNSMLEGVNERPMTSLRIRGESIGACDARFMNNVIRATTAIMGIIRYPGLHVRQQTTRYVGACVRMRALPMCESRALFLLRRVSPPCQGESVLCTPRCTDNQRQSAERRNGD